MIIKARERIIRGPLKSFDDLPLNVQESFKEVKVEINKVIDCDVFVFGSYAHGYWDEFSDLDVILFIGDDEIIYNKLRIALDGRADVLLGKNNVGYIQIP
jgi:predicted nucleotidyltransferase